MRKLRYTLYLDIYGPIDEQLELAAKRLREEVASYLERLANEKQVLATLPTGAVTGAEFGARAAVGDLRDGWICSIKIEEAE